MKTSPQFKNEDPLLYLTFDSKNEINLIINKNKLIGKGGQRMVSESIAFYQNKWQRFVTSLPLHKQAEIDQKKEKELAVKFSNNPFVMPIIYGDGESFSPRMTAHLGAIFSNENCSVPTEANMLWMIYSLMEGLNDLHSNDILHNDLKEENLLFKLNKQGNYCLYIADMGSASAKNDHSTQLVGNFDNMAFDTTVLQPLLKELLDLDHTLLTAIQSLRSLTDGSQPYKNLKSIEEARKIEKSDLDVNKTLQFFLEKRDAKVLAVIRAFEPSKEYKFDKPFDSVFNLQSANEIPSLRCLLQFIEKNNIPNIQFPITYVSDKNDVWSLCSVILKMLDWYEKVNSHKLPTIFIDLRDHVNKMLTTLDKDRCSSKQLLNEFIMLFNNMLVDKNTSGEMRQKCIQLFSTQSTFHNVRSGFMGDQTKAEIIVSKISSPSRPLTENLEHKQTTEKYQSKKSVKRPLEDRHHFSNFFKYFSVQPKSPKPPPQQFYKLTQ